MTLEFEKLTLVFYSHQNLLAHYLIVEILKKKEINEKKIEKNMCFYLFGCEGENKEDRTYERICTWGPLILCSLQMWRVIKVGREHKK